MRRRLEHQGFGADHGFRWRGGDSSRLEGLADALELTGRIRQAFATSTRA
jgi:hypothetical protein